MNAATKQKPEKPVNKGALNPAPRPVYALLRCGLVMGPLQPIEVNGQRCWWLGRYVEIDGIEATWTFTGKHEVLQFEIVNMFEMGEEFDSAHSRVAPKGGA